MCIRDRSNGGRYGKVATDRGRQRDKVCNWITVVHVGSSVCTVELLFSVADILIQTPLIKKLRGKFCMIMSNPVPYVTTKIGVLILSGYPRFHCNKSR